MGDRTSAERDALRLRHKHMPSMIDPKRTAALPPTVPAIIATSLLDVPVVAELLAELLEVDEVVVVDDMPAVIDGEVVLMHEKLPVPTTCSNPEIPPCLPKESVTKYMRFVPPVTSVTEVKLSLLE